MKQFELPEKWCIKVTPENVKILIKWRGQPIGDPYGYCFVGHPDQQAFTGYWNDKNDVQFPEITFEQFEKYVLNKDEPISNEKDDYSHLVKLLKQIK